MAGWGWNRGIAISLSVILVVMGCRPAYGGQEKPALIQPVIPYGELENGDFEEGKGEFGPVGWEVWFSETGDHDQVSWGVSKGNGTDSTKKLSLYNGLGHSVDFSLTQKIYHMKAGTYTAALIFEGDSGDKSSGTRLQVNEETAAFGKLIGDNNWKQVVIPEVMVEEGGEADINISGKLSAKEWMDIDSVVLTPKEDFVSNQAALKAEAAVKRAVVPARHVQVEKVSREIKNGRFSQGLIWDAIGYPDGYLPGWTLQASPSDAWVYDTENGSFRLRNIGDQESRKEYTVSQKVRLGEGSWQIDSYLGGDWDDVGYNECCMRVREPDGTLIDERYWTVGYGQVISDEFKLKVETEITVSFTFLLSGGRKATLGKVFIHPYPAKISWESARQVGGRDKKEDTQKILVRFNREVFGLDKKNFSISGGTISSLEDEKDGSYLLSLDDLREGNGKNILITVTNPEGTYISPRKRNVSVYRDDEGLSGNLINGDFSTPADWSMEGYPDGYVKGWILPRIDWNTWKYSDTGDDFEVTNISGDTSKKSFAIRQTILLEPGTYHIAAKTPWTWDEGNPWGVTIKVKAGNRLLAVAAGNPGYGEINSAAFTIEKEAQVETTATFSLAGGKGAALDYVSIAPGNPPTSGGDTPGGDTPGGDTPGGDIPEAIPTQVVNGDFSTGIDWSQTEKYPNGYLKGWKLPETIDFDQWRFNTLSGNFELNNVSGSREGTFAISQKIKLEAGKYDLSASSPYTWDGANPDGVAVTVKDGDTKLARLKKNPGYGSMGTASFTLSQQRVVTLNVTLKLVPGGCTAVDDVDIKPAASPPPTPPPPFEDPLVNGSFSEEMTYQPTTLPGFRIPADDWSLWSPVVVSDKGFKVENVKTDGAAEIKTYEITQQVKLMPGTYRLEADLAESWIPSVTTAAGGKAMVTVFVASYTQADSKERSGWAEAEAIRTDDFTISEETTVTVGARFKLPSGMPGDLSYVIMKDIRLKN